MSITTTLSSRQSYISSIDVNKWITAGSNEVKIYKNSILENPQTIVGSSNDFYVEFTSTSNTNSIMFNFDTTSSIFMIGGGGGGGNNIGGGGGAGGYYNGTYTFLANTTYNIFIGNGGNPNTNGGDTYITDINNNKLLWVYGGGAGGNFDNNGADGGCGGGGSRISGVNDTGRSGGTAIVNSTNSTGKNGAVGYGTVVYGFASGGGGGGASSVGLSPYLFTVNIFLALKGGVGGNAITINYKGYEEYYGAGGGGGIDTNTQPPGFYNIGNGGLTKPGGSMLGGVGSSVGGKGNDAMVSNSGSGGGGGGANFEGGKGSSGFCIIKFTKYTNSRFIINNKMPSSAYNSNLLSITENGNVGIGVYNPTNKLEVSGNIVCSGENSTIKIIDITSIQRPELMFIRGSNNEYGGDSQIDWSIYTDSGGHFHVRSYGLGSTNAINADNFLLYYTGGGWLNGTLTQSSDQKLKTNILQLKNSLLKILKLRGVQYNMIQNINKLYIGLIAQEVEEVIPEVVNTGVDGLKGIEYSNIVSILIEAIKEQNTIIQDLKQRIEILETKL